LLWLILPFYDFSCFLTFIYIYNIYSYIHPSAPDSVDTIPHNVDPSVYYGDTVRCGDMFSGGILRIYPRLFGGPQYRTDNCPHMGRVCLVIPPPTQSSGWRYSVFQQKFLSFIFFFSFANGSSRWLYRQGTFIAQKVGYRYNFINWVQNLGATPIKIWGCNISPNFVISDFCDFFVHFLSDLIAGLYTKRLAMGAVGGGIPIRCSSVEIISSDTRILLILYYYTSAHT